MGSAANSPCSACSPTRTTTSRSPSPANVEIAAQAGWGIPTCRPGSPPCTAWVAPCIGGARARLVTPEQYAEAAATGGRRPGRSLSFIADVYGQYEEQKRKRKLVDFDDMLEGAHARGIRVIVDLVPNHSSDQHEWFQQALTAAPGSPERARYIFREGRGIDGDVPPNNW